MMRSIWFWSQIPINATKNENRAIFFHSLLFNIKVWFRLLEVIEPPTKPQFQPLSMSSKNVWVNILSEAAVMERQICLNEKTRLYRFSWLKQTKPNFKLISKSFIKILIFTDTKRECDNIAYQLKRIGNSAAAIHGDKVFKLF